jgi:hypothetical protein
MPEKKQVIEVEKLDEEKIQQLVPGEYKNLNIFELVNGYNHIKNELELAEGEAPDELVEMYDIAQSLISGKVDRVALNRERLLLHRKACEEQIKNIDWMLNKIDSFTELVLNKVEGNVLEGDVATIKIKKNPPSVVIDDEEKITDEYKKYKVSISDSFDATNKSMFNFYAGVALKRIVDDKNPLTKEEIELVGKKLKKEIKKTDIKKAINDNKEIDGARLDRKTKVEYKIGKAQLKGV